MINTKLKIKNVITYIQAFLSKFYTKLFCSSWVGWKLDAHLLSLLSCFPYQKSSHDYSSRSSFLWDPIIKLAALLTLLFSQLDKTTVSSTFLCYELQCL